MKVTLNWLKQYVDFNWSPEELTERLTLLGLEVEGVHKVAGDFEGIVVAQVITRDKHPNADKLSLCRVNDGRGERQIVCGAHNFKAGDKVPLILPGASLPPKPGETQPFTIKVGKIRGLESQGMLCSPQELGLSDDVDGLLLLRDDARVGQPFAEYLGRSGGDAVYDLEVTPNRPDWNSVVGIAREIAALTGNPLKLPEIKIPASNSKIEDLAAIRVEDAELCPRYTARLVRGVKIGPSPDWLRSTLEKVGIRSINNVVDVTNFVMMEIGQPLHAFDYRLLAKAADGKPTIVVRRAAANEKFTTLDGQARTLTGDMLLIADEQHGIALAGIMGGQNTEINNATTDVLIESACFEPANIRRTSKTLGLRSESSYRFERGADPGVSDWAGARCAQLILETAGGEVAEGLLDIRAAEIKPKEITLRHHKVNELLGLSLRPEEIEYFLGQLGLKITQRKVRPVGEDGPPEPVTFRIPPFRVDLKREADLIEEVARLYGVDKIPATPPRGALGVNAHDDVHDDLAEARRLLVGMGLYETQGQTLVSGAEPGASGANTIALANPLSADMDVLRPSLLPGLIQSLRHNVSRKNHDLALFEIGRVFSSAGGGTGEQRRLAIALTGQRHPLFWSGEARDAKCDVFDLKGVLDEFLEQFGLRGVAFARRLDNTGVFLESATVRIVKDEVGEFGQLTPALAKRSDLRDAVFLAELNLDALLKWRVTAKSFKPLPAFPAIRRDVAMVVPEQTMHDSVVRLVKQTKPGNLESVELFDVFRGGNVPAGQKSMAYAFTYRHAERTLTDNEVNAAHDKVVAAFKLELKATVRE
jgi:phenylalanyl-tRNA synthetase beta chain